MNENSKGISLFHPATILGTCFWIGKIPVAPGTFGSIFAAFLLAALALQPRVWGFDPDLLPYILFGSTLFIYLLGVWVSNIYVKRTGNKDPKEIVIDEVAGMFVTASLIVLVYFFLLKFDYDTFYTLLVFSPWYLVIGFILFRVFDIWKPGIIKTIDRKVEGGQGVMLDDVVAGIFAAIAFYVLLFIALYTGLLSEVVADVNPAWVE